MFPPPEALLSGLCVPIPSSSLVPPALDPVVIRCPLQPRLLVAPALTQLHTLCWRPMPISKSEVQAPTNRKLSSVTLVSLQGASGPSHLWEAVSPASLCQPQEGLCDQGELSSPTPTNQTTAKGCSTDPAHWPWPQAGPRPLDQQCSCPSHWVSQEDFPKSSLTSLRRHNGLRTWRQRAASQPSAC